MFLGSTRDGSEKRTNTSLKELFQGDNSLHNIRKTVLSKFITQIGKVGVEVKIFVQKYVKLFTGSGRKDRVLGKYSFHDMKIVWILSGMLIIITKDDLNIVGYIFSLKGALARDFRLPFFFIKSTLLVP
jgi:hypothetical protein